MIAPSFAPDSIVTAADGLIVAELSGEVVILSLHNGIYYGLDAVGATIWGLIQQPTTIARLCAVITQQYDVSAEQCEQDLVRLIVQLAAEKLIEVRHGQASAQMATA
jgi:Coenzyme PQQ synthesis protein D (PqqD)